MIVSRKLLPLLALLCMLLLNAAAAMAGDVVIIVSAKSAVTALSRSQVADIFLGRTSRFPNGGNAVPIDQAEGSPVRDEFYLSLTGRSAAQLKAYWSKIIFTGRGQPPPSMASALATRQRIAADPNAIGYIERSMLDGSVRALD
jgi:ABC-type phosphate transport system substrate-binding protein